MQINGDNLSMIINKTENNNCNGASNIVYSQSPSNMTILNSLPNNNTNSYLISHNYSSLQDDKQQNIDQNNNFPKNFQDMYYSDSSDEVIIYRPIPKKTKSKRKNIEIIPPKNSRLTVHIPSAFIAICKPIPPKEFLRQQEGIDQPKIVICSTCNKRVAMKTAVRQYKTCRHCCKARRAKYRRQKREFSDDVSY